MMSVGQGAASDRKRDPLSEFVVEAPEPMPDPRAAASNRLCADRWAERRHQITFLVGRRWIDSDFARPPASEVDVAMRNDVARGTGGPAATRGP